MRAPTAWEIQFLGGDNDAESVTVGFPCGFWRLCSGGWPNPRRGEGRFRFPTGGCPEPKGREMPVRIRHTGAITIADPRGRAARTSSVSFFTSRRLRSGRLRPPSGPGARGSVPFSDSHRLENDQRGRRPKSSVCDVAGASLQPAEAFARFGLRVEHSRPAVWDSHHRADDTGPFHISRIFIIMKTQRHYIPFMTMFSAESSL